MSHVPSEIQRAESIRTTPRYLPQAKITELFGDPAPFIRDDGSVSHEWETQILGTVTLPDPLPLAWAPKSLVTKIRCHKRLVTVLSAVFSDLFAQSDLWSLVNDYAGCYSWRLQRGATLPSRHCWAAAIDINANDNPLGTVPKMDPRIVAVFAAHGFYWGGNFKNRKDGMHYEWGLESIPA
jgi:hypothetical protein